MPTTDALKLTWLSKKALVFKFDFILPQKAFSRAPFLELIIPRFVSTSNVAILIFTFLATDGQAYMQIYFAQLYFMLSNFSCVCHGHIFNLPFYYILICFYENHFGFYICDKVLITPCHSISFCELLNLPLFLPFNPFNFCILCYDKSTQLSETATESSPSFIAEILQ